MKKEPSAATLGSWKASVEENGQRGITVRQLLRAFGYQRRSEAGLASIQNYLQQNGLYVGLYESVGIDDSVQLTGEPVRRIGSLYEKEADIEARFPDEILRRVGLKKMVAKEYSPKGTRDRLDFLCEDKDGRSVVVELKANSGDKRAVEQVLRYIGMLKAENRDKDPWGILITGSADMHTRRALEGRKSDDHIRWWIYGLRGDELVLEEVHVGAGR